MIVLLPLIVGTAAFVVGWTLLPASRSEWLESRVGVRAARPAPVAPVTDGRRLLLARLELPLLATERRVVRFRLWQRFDALVERAALPLRTIEVAYAAAGIALLVALVALLAGAQPLVAFVLSLLVLAGGRIALSMRATRRVRAFDDQLPELLGALASALRAGHGFTQALHAISLETAEPAASELKRVFAETRLGRPLEDALADLGRRIGSKEFEFVLDAVVIQRQVGGSLASIFDIVADAVQQQHQFLLRVRALTAMGRTSATVLVALPFAVALLLTALNSGYMKPLYHTSAGQILLVCALILIGIGAAWLQRIVRCAG